LEDAHHHRVGSVRLQHSHPRASCFWSQSESGDFAPTDPGQDFRHVDFMWPLWNILDFALLADEDHAVAESYGVWVTKKNYGREYLGNERTTFIVDADGKVAEVLRKVKPADHDELVLKALELAAPPVT
jgi:AhpC/TSA family